MATNSMFDVIHITNAAAPFCQGKNDYSCLQEMAGKFGVYVFQSKSTNDVLYVGEAHKQDLKTRIKQNYTENDTGGTFRKNFCETEGKSFEEFKALLTDSNIKAISIETKSKILIIGIEAILISALNPKYNK
ncbi:GIY-YIG nuclease family protein [Aeromonas salmonicida]|uniref:GIY-YIG nuclease family protein n=1 Tax=Aeromonas salmonicida TaxID=645 RepID=UPI0030D1D4FF